METKGPFNAFSLTVPSAFKRCAASQRQHSMPFANSIYSLLHVLFFSLLLDNGKIEKENMWKRGWEGNLISGELWTVPVNALIAVASLSIL